MSSTMTKVALLVEARRIEIDERPIPEIGENDALIRVERAGLCGTDYKLYTGGLGRSYPIIPGHEILGHIERIGSEMARREKLAVGDRVVVEASIPCGHCEFCIDGLYRLCTTGRYYGFTSASTAPYLWGAFAEVMYVAPGSLITKISERTSPAAAIVASSSLANGIRWMRTVGGAEIGKSALIQGVGAQGLSAVVAAKESGASPIIVTGVTADGPRFALARELGADVCIDVQKDDVVAEVRRATNGEMASVVLDVSGSPEAIALSVQLVRTLGTIVCASSVSGNKPSSIVTNEIVRKEVRFQGVWTHTLESTRQALRLAETGRYPLEKFISHEFSLDDADKAVRSIGRELSEIEPIKVSITP
jgi:alcohol dehydrogenase